MRKIFLLLLVVSVISIYGCSKETVEEPEHPGKITAYTYKIDEIKQDEPEEKNITTVKLCHDTDNGIVRWESGQVYGFYDNASRFEFTDYCQNFNWLWEFYCENEEPKQHHFFCRNGCENNHCL